MGDNKIPGCFKYGCIGCLTLCALCLGLIFFFGAVQLAFEPEDPKPEQRQLTQELPSIPAQTFLSDQPEGATILPLPRDPKQRPPKGVIVLDISMAELIISPGPEGEPIRVEADYDSNGFNLEENFTTTEDGAWQYELSFKSRKSFFNLLGSNNINNEIELILPRGQPFEIIGEIGLGESEADLGGLWLEGVDLEYGLGDHFVEFREPLPFAMPHLRIDSSMGNLELRTVGHASPGEVVVDHNMGDVLVDLDGHWRNNSNIEVDLNMGQGRVWVPHDVKVRANVDVNLGEKRLDLPDEESLPEDTPVLTIDLKGNLGEMSVEG